jgi:ParB-like chromosome segregation protein Spo0J
MSADDQDHETGTSMTPADEAGQVPIFQPMPPLTTEEREALRADIVEHGVQVPITVDQHGRILDGHNRAAIAVELGIECPRVVVEVADDDDAWSRALALNLGRRHLTREQKRDVIRAELRRRPDDSDREIARRCACSPTTVGTVRLSNLDTEGLLDIIADDADTLADRAAARPQRTLTELLQDEGRRQMRELVRLLTRAQRLCDEGIELGWLGETSSTYIDLVSEVFGSISGAAELVRGIADGTPPTGDRRWRDLLLVAAGARTVTAALSRLEGVDLVGEVPAVLVPALHEAVLAIGEVDERAHEFIRTVYVDDEHDDDDKTRPGVSKWSRAVQRVSKACTEAELTNDELDELLGAATFLANYCRGVLTTRKRAEP